MKKIYLLLITLILMQTHTPLNGRAYVPGESLWSMQRLVAQASCDYTIRQSDFSGGALTISTAGVYCLAENCTGAITISSNNVVLDLNSKTLTGNASTALSISANYLEIRNGTVTNPSAAALSVQSGKNNISLKLLNIIGSYIGIHATTTNNNISVESCIFNNNDISIFFNTTSHSQIKNCTALDSTTIGFYLLNCEKNMISGCTICNTGQGNSDPNVGIYGFISQNGTRNLFQNCVAQNTLATTVTGASNVAAGFAFRGTETLSTIRNCTSGVVETSNAGFAIPYGIKLDYTFDSLTTVTGGNQGTSCYALDWSPDGAFLATGGTKQNVNDEIQIFSFDRSTGLLTTLTGASQGTLCSTIAWSPDGAYLATGGDTEGASDDIQIFSFDPVAGLLTKLDGAPQGNNCYSVAWSPDGTYLATGGLQNGGDNDEIQVFSFDRSTGLLSRLNGASQGGFCNSVSWSPDGAYLATGGDTQSTNDEIQIFSFNRSTGLLERVSAGLQSSCNSVAWSSDGAYVASGGTASSVKNVQIFSFTNSTQSIVPVAEVNAVGGVVRTVTWSPDNRYIAVTSNDGIGTQVFKFDQSSPPSLTQVDRVGGSRTNAWSPDGAYLASGGSAISLNEFQIFNAFQFPSSNTIINNLVHGARRESSPAAGVGISGSSIENLIAGNRSYDNAGFNYQMVPNVFDERFGSEPTTIQNISMHQTPPFYAP